MKNPLKDIETLSGYIVEQKKKAKKVGSMVIPESIEHELDNEGVVYLLPKNNPLGLKIGETVIFRAYCGEKIKINSMEYLVLSPDEILAKYK